MITTIRFYLYYLANILTNVNIPIGGYPRLSEVNYLFSTGLQKSLHLSLSKQLATISISIRYTVICS